MSTDSSTQTPITESLTKKAQRQTLVEMESSEFSNSGNGAPRATLGEWAEKHGLCLWLTPIKRCSNDPIQLGLTIARSIEDCPELQKSLTRNYMNISKVDTTSSTKLLRMHKARLLRKSQKRNRYWNPNYLHYDHCITPFETPEEQLSFYNRFISVGVVSPSWIVKHFKLSEANTEIPLTPDQHTFDREALDLFVDAHTEYPDVATHLADVRKSITRTLFSILAWGEWSVDELTTATNISPAIFSQWVTKYVDNTGWKPPQRPSEQVWFSQVTTGEAYRNKEET